MNDDTQPMPDMVENLKRLREFDETIRTHQARVAAAQAALAIHESAKERYLQRLTPSATYYPEATHRQPRLF